MPRAFPWDQERVLITGATGFIGSWLTEALLRKKAQISVLIRKGDFLAASISRIMNKIECIYGDIRDAKIVNRAVKDKDTVFHLAAITQVIEAIRKPEETLQVNLFGTFNILESMRKGTGNQFLVYASTDKVYGEPKCLPIDEEHPLSAKSPYDASKLAADRLVYSYAVTYGLEVSIARWSNTIGGRDANISRIVPDFITSVLDGRPPAIRGDGSHIRDYMYITDAVSGITSIAENRSVSKGEAFNFGTEKPTSVVELANMIIRLMGHEGTMKPMILGQPTPGEIRKQVLCSKKANRMLGWKPVVDLETALTRTIQWYKKNPTWRNIMRRQIKRETELG